ncbi:hypothetical protein RN001_006708 [Aquatica leii]|uniref:Myb/SANT-like DNA-binding domain-containing protein n=1 Tax=Aquatica leii TaxID=1421715 RepID=A0AAN7PE03_9COLE|nr:hypothetical protein RN001_006708 [Aquatica leii]
MSRRALSHAELLKEFEDLQQYESDCELPSNNNSTDEDSDFVIDVTESQKSSSNSDETTSPLSTLTRRNSITDIASTSSCVQPIRSFRGTSRGTSKGRRSRGNCGRKLDDDKYTLGAESERVEETGSDATIWKILDTNQTFAEDIIESTDNGNASQNITDMSQSFQSCSTSKLSFCDGLYDITTGLATPYDIENMEADDSYLSQEISSNVEEGTSINESVTNDNRECRPVEESEIIVQNDNTNSEIQFNNKSGNSVQNEENVDRPKRMIQISDFQYETYLKFMENTSIAFRESMSYQGSYIPKKWKELAQTLNSCDVGPNLTASEWYNHLSDWRGFSRRRTKNLIRNRKKFEGDIGQEETTSTLEERDLAVRGHMAVTETPNVSVVGGLQCQPIEIKDIDLPINHHNDSEILETVPVSTAKPEVVDSFSNTVLNTNCVTPPSTSEELRKKGKIIENGSQTVRNTGPELLERYQNNVTPRKKTAPLEKNKIILEKVRLQFEIAKFKFENPGFDFDESLVTLVILESFEHPGKFILLMLEFFEHPVKHLHSPLQQLKISTHHWLEKSYDDAFLDECDHNDESDIDSEHNDNQSEHDTNSELGSDINNKPEDRDDSDDQSDAVENGDPLETHFYGKNNFKWSAELEHTKTRTKRHNIVLELSGLRGHNYPTTAEGQEFSWTRNSTLLLIANYEKLATNFRNPKTKKKDLWVQTKLNFAEYGHIVTEEILDRKCRNLKKTFTSIKDNIKRTGRGQISWEHFYAFDAIYKEDRTINVPKTISSVLQARRSATPEPVAVASAGTSQTPITAPIEVSPRTSRSLQNSVSCRNKAV